MTNSQPIPLQSLPPLPTHMGGAKFQKIVMDWAKQSNNLFLAVFGIIMVVWAVFAEKLPVNVRSQLTTTLGRLLLLLLLYIIHELLGWTYALVFTVAVALTWANQPLWPVENFEVKTTNVACKPKWFVEKVLKENPVVITEDRVSTYPVEDDNSFSGRVSR